MHSWTAVCALRLFPSRRSLRVLVLAAAVRCHRTLCPAYYLLTRLIPNSPSPLQGCFQGDRCNFAHVPLGAENGRGPGPAAGMKRPAESDAGRQGKQPRWQ